MFNAQASKKDISEETKVLNQTIEELRVNNEELQAQKTQIKESLVKTQSELAKMITHMEEADAKRLVEDSEKVRA